MDLIELEEYVTAGGHAPFSAWLEKLDDAQARVRIARRLTRLRAGLFGDSAPVGAGVLELREDYGPGYRVYMGRHGKTRVILLVGGDKRTQQRDIEHAHRYWQDWKKRQSR